MLVVPLALAVALPWALALLPYGLWLGGAAVGNCAGASNCWRG
ncbi:MAG: hypothetical protein U0841_12615 [Chloroflexia bacterium]